MGIIERHLDPSKVFTAVRAWLMLGTGIFFGIYLGPSAGAAGESGNFNQAEIQRQYISNIKSIESFLKVNKKNLSRSSLLLGLKGPRFFDPETWALAHKDNIHPGKLYKPLTTWAHWVRTDIYLEDLAEINNQRGRVPEINMDWIKSLYARAMSISEGEIHFRKDDVLGLALVPRNRLTADEFSNLDSSPKSSHIEPRIQFFPTVCDAEIPSGYLHFRDIPKAVQESLVLTRESLKLKEQIEQNAVCGFFLYPEAEKVEILMKRWIDEFNFLVKEGNQQDPYIWILRLARNLVAIHPFDDGNGRLSRMIHDYLLQSLGFPPPIFKDMNKDYIYSEAQWIEEAKAGSLHFLNVQNKCIEEFKNQSQASYDCQIIELKNLVPNSGSISAGFGK